MRLRPKDAHGAPGATFLLCFLISFTAASSSPSTSLNLSDFQQINGFDSACTVAYNTPIPGCSTSDFTSNNPCSLTCINGLEVITILLGSACQGIEADPTTLIGQFFEGNGIKALCPNFVPAQTLDSSAFAQLTGRPGASTTNAQTSTTPQYISTTSSQRSTGSSLSASTEPILTSTSLTSSSSTSLSLTMTSSILSTQVSLASSSTSLTTSPSLAVVPAGTTPSSSSTQSDSGFTKTIVNDGSAVVITSKPEQTASNNPDAFGGGGSPFEISEGVHALDVLYTLYGLVIFSAMLWLL
ncbi:hypothetical protein MMC13_003557 [Lambiella insularis]|nr:hypothetical protein [Lambiella insularis]